METRAFAWLAALLLAVFLSAAPLVQAARPYCRFDGKLVMSNLIRELDSAGNYTTLLGVLKQTDLDEDLVDLFSCYEATLFAPTDAAFDRLPEDARKAVDKDDKVLREVVLLHLMQKRLPFNELLLLPQGKQFKAAAGGCKARLVKASSRRVQPVVLQAKDGSQEASIVAADVITLRVVQVHGVGDVILPKALKKGDGDSLKPGNCVAWAA